MQNKARPLHIPTMFSQSDPALFRRLDEVTLGVFDCPHSTPELASFGPIVVRTQDIRTGVLRIEEAARVTEEIYRERIARAEPTWGDLLYSREGTYFGIAAEVPKGERVCLGQRMVLIRPDPAKVDHRYLKYWLNSPQIASHVNGFRDGSVAERLNLPTIQGLPVLIRSLPEQRAIARVLGALDDKIEQNGRMARTLERLAQAVFRAWFVDFEPIKAKAAGAISFPSMQQAVFDALPALTDHLETAPAPEGWEVKMLTNLFDVNPPRSLRKGELAPYLDMKNMPTDGHAPDELSVRPAGSGAKFVNGDTLVARITPCLENGKTAFVDFLGDGEVAWGSTEYIVLRPRPPIPPIFAYLLARTNEFRSFAIQSMTGTSGRQRVPFSALEHFSIPTPPSDILLAFGELVGPLIARSSTATRESRSLARLRDLLLPRLLSGELRVGRGGAR